MLEKLWHACFSLQENGASATVLQLPIKLANFLRKYKPNVYSLGKLEGYPL